MNAKEFVKGKKAPKLTKWEKLCRAMFNAVENGTETCAPIIQDIKMERIQQIRKFGEPKLTPCELLAILMEEVGEVAAAINDGDMDNYRTELVQVAAVAVKAIQYHDQRKKK